MAELLRGQPERQPPPPEGVTRRQWLLMRYLLIDLRKGRIPALIELDEARALGFLVALEIDFDKTERLRHLVRNATDHARADGAAERAEAARQLSA